MKLFTLNAHSHTGELAKKRQALLEEFLIKEAPHIISLQEVNQSMSAPPMAKEKLPPSIIKVDGAPSVPIKEGNSALSLLLALRNAGHDYRLAWLPVKCGYGRLDEGLAILSRLPVTDASGFYISRTHSYDNWKTRMALSLRLCGECVTVCALHTSRYDDPDEPFIDQWERLRVALKDEGHLLLMGDFNNPAEVRGGGYDRILSDGFFDLYAQASIKEGEKTTLGAIDGWSDTAKGQRIDFIFSNMPLGKRHVTCRTVLDGVRGEPVSDHFGVMAEIN